MINLLSPQAKQRLWNEYRMRLAVIILIALALLEVFTAVLFLFPFITLHNTTSGLQADLDRVTQNSPASNKEISTEVKTAKADLAVLKQGGKPNDTLPSALISSIIKEKPKGITISNLAYARVGDTVSLQFSGVAATREDILSFRGALEKNPLFSLSRGGDYLIKKTNIAFSITLTMK